MAKIIGTTGRDGLLLEIGRDELANLVGFYYESEKGCPAFVVGQQVAIHQMYKRLYGLKGSSERLKGVADTLRGFASLLDQTVSPIVQAADSDAVEGGSH